MLYTLSVMSTLIRKYTLILGDSTPGGSMLRTFLLGMLAGVEVGRLSSNIFIRHL